MSRIVRGGLIQCANPLNDESVSVAKIKQAALDAHLPFVEEAARKGAAAPPGRASARGARRRSSSCVARS
jgi:hypothetical protein